MDESALAVTAIVIGVISAVFNLTFVKDVIDHILKRRAKDAAERRGVQLSPAEIKNFERLIEQGRGSEAISILREAQKTSTDPTGLAAKSG